MRRGPRVAVLAAAGLALPLAVLLAVVAAGDSEAGLCTPERMPPARADLVAVGPDPVGWNLYSEPVDQQRLLHNRAHGGIVVQYGDRVRVPVIDRVAVWYRSDPVGVVVAPLAELDTGMRVSAWAASLRCRGFDEQEFARFRDEHRFRGPERIPPAALRPTPVVRVVPQPVRGRATISFAIPPPGRVEVVIRAGSGLTVRRLGSYSGRSGQQLALRWDGRDRLGRRLRPGRYVVALLPAGRSAISAQFRVG